MKLKIMIMALLFLVGIGSAVNRLPATEFTGDISFRDENSDSYIMDMSGEPAPDMGYGVAFNDSSGNYEQVALYDPISVTVGEVSLTNPKTWFYDYKVHATLPGCYDTMLEALNAACDGFAVPSTAHVSIAPGSYNLPTSWLINISNSNTRSIIIEGNGAELIVASGDGVVINNSENSARYANLIIQGVTIIGSGYADGNDGITFDVNSVAIPKFLFNDIYTESFNVGFNLSETVAASDIAPYGSACVNCNARYTNIGFWIDGCHNAFYSCVADYNPQGSTSKGFYIDGRTSSQGMHSLFHCDSGKSETGYHLNSNTGGCLLLNPYSDGAVSAAYPAINISKGYLYSTKVYNPVCGLREIHIGNDGTNYVSAQIYGAGEYTGYKPGIILGDKCIGTYIENNGRYRSLNITDNGAVGTLYIGFYQGTSSTFPGISRVAGSVMFNSDPDTSEAAAWSWDGEASHAWAALA